MQEFRADGQLVGSKAQSKPQPKPGFPHVQSNITLAPLHWGIVVVVVVEVVVVGQGPQLRVPPQPLAIIPQSAAPQVVGVQPHWLGTPPPPQVCGAVQVPQLSVSPQSPSGIVRSSCPAPCRWSEYNTGRTWLVNGLEEVQA